MDKKIKMSTNKNLNGKNTDLTGLFKLYLVKSASAANSGWLGEMDGETTEEDWPIYTNHTKLDGQNSCPSFKKVLRGSPITVSYKWQD